MKISFNLLRRLIDFKWSVDELAHKLTMSGSEVEHIQEKGSEISGVVAARVESVERVADSDKLTICRLYDGKGNIQVVCGAPNVATGQTVLFAPPGSSIPGMALEKTTVHGVESSGMILSEAELELSDNEAEIAVLSDSAKPGTALDEMVEYRDTIFDLEITPNRSDCLSHIGIAREIQAMGGGRMRLPEIHLDEIAEKAEKVLSIAIDDPEGCPRYTGRVIRNVRIGPSPLWLKMILYYLGMRPINNVVDITNYVMLELGHPLHAFDYDLFSRPQVVVRRAQLGERFVTLDSVIRELNSEHLMITDGQEGVAIAGIMGGEKSEVSGKTSNILLESAYFNPVRIRRGSKALGLATESSRRFERGADPRMAPLANDRACEFIAQLAEGKTLKGMIDAHPEPFTPATIELRPEKVNSILGSDINAGKMADILQALDIKVSRNGRITAEQPSFRPDLTREIDLIEEIARIYGLDNIPAVFKPGGALVTPESRESRIIDRVRSYLVGAGGIEIFPMTLVDSRMVERFGLSESAVRLMNPLSEEMAVVRPNLILSLLPVIRRNLNFKEKDLFLFELGSIYIPTGKGQLPRQSTSLIIAMTGEERPVFWNDSPPPRDLFSLKGALECLAEHLNICRPRLKPGSHFAFEETRCFEVYMDEIMAGHMGKISAKACSIADIKGDVFVAELDFEKIAELVPDSPPMTELDRFPSADRDIAIIVDEGANSEEIRELIFGSGRGLVSSVVVFDLYKGRNIPKDRKSLAFAIEFRSPDRTLTDQEVDEAQGRILKSLKDKFGAELRS
jgi:phenylalanyl-tRNA synthetase beta chain